MPKFTVTVVREMSQSGLVEVEAVNAEAAETEALQLQHRSRIAWYPAEARSDPFCLTVTPSAPA